MNPAVASSAAVLEFWFGAEPDDPASMAARNRRWFRADDDFDAEIRTRFTATLEAAAAGSLRRWKLSPRGTLALVIVFDQFPRNIHRGTPQAFAFDARALALCRDAVAMGSDLDLSVIERAFFYLPFEHAEDLEAQDKSVACFEQLHEQAPPALAEYTRIALEHARQHRQLIAEFGRFPHRNLALGRASTPAENAWLRDNRGTYGQG